MYKKVFWHQSSPSIRRNYVIVIPPIKPFNSQKRLTCNFSLIYPNTVHQMSHENIQTYQVEVVIFI